MIDRKNQAEVHLIHFETAIEQQDLSAALEQLQQALALDPSRCPFPAEQYELTQILAASNIDVELLCRHRASNAHLIFKAPRAAGQFPADEENGNDADGVLSSNEFAEYPEEDPLADELPHDETYSETQDEASSEEDDALDQADAYEGDAEASAEEDDSYEEEDDEAEYDPEQAAFLCDRGREHKANGDLAQAFEDFTEAIWLDPDSTDAFNSRGNLYFAARQYDEAIADYTEAIRVSPDLAITYLNRGLAHARKQQSAEALADANEALRLDPTLAGAHYLRGTSRYRLEDLDGAIADLTNAIRLNAADPAVHNQRGLAYAKLGDYDRAIEDYDQALRLAPDLTLAHFNRASAYQLKGDPIRAVAGFSSAVQLDPQNAEAYYQRGLAYAAQGEHDSAIGDFTESYRLDPNNNLAVFKRDEVKRAKKASAKASPEKEPLVAAPPANPNGQRDVTCPGCGKRLTPSELRRRQGRCRECKARLPAPPKKAASVASPKTAKKDASPPAPRFARRRWFAIGGGVAACLLLGAGGWMWMAARTPSAELTAYDLWWECANESLRATRKYDGKLLKVAGVVEEVLPGAAPRIVFREPFAAPPPVECYIDPKANQSDIQVNQWVTVVGKCKCNGGPEQPVQLLRCRVVNTP
jgi:tetratricopeptide (TPR) repeat protein